MTPRTGLLTAMTLAVVATTAASQTIEVSATTSAPSVFGPPPPPPPIQCPACGRRFKTEAGTLRHVVDCHRMTPEALDAAAVAAGIR